MALTIQTLRRLVAMDPNDSVSQFSLGQKLFREGNGDADTREAVTHLRRACELDPKYLVSQYTLAQALVAVGEVAEAKGLLMDACGRAKMARLGEGHDLVPEMEAMLESLE